MVGFYADTNSITGSIPTSIGSLSNLAIFIAHTNSMTGSIPSSIGSLSKLITIHADTNSTLSHRSAVASFGESFL
jgi:hypothetical protein